MKSVISAFAFLCFLVAEPLCGFASDLRVLSLNLHGYHPMGEKRRFLQYKDGSVQKVPSFLFYFTEEELNRGNKKRLDTLARAIHKLDPDLVLFQEVGAGKPNVTKTCDDFERSSSNDDDDINTVLRLERRLRSAGFRATVGCRGNLGWTTSEQEFEFKRPVVKAGQNWSPVFDYGAVPYGGAVLIEGFGMLYGNNLRLASSDVWNVKYDQGRQSMAVHVALFYKTGKRSAMLVANVHAGHKVAHFEGAVATRMAISQFVSKHPRKGDIDTVIIGGDFNATLHRPQQNRKDQEISSVPWEVTVQGEYDYANLPEDPSLARRLADQLNDLNQNDSYKPWARIKDGAEARRRIHQAVDSFSNWLAATKKTSADARPLQEALSVANTKKLCRPVAWIEGSCDDSERIDLIFATPNLHVKNSYVAFSRNGWESLDGVSDHPGLVAEFEYSEP